MTDDSLALHRRLGCGATLEEWKANGCKDGSSALEQCDVCTGWEADYWDAVERDV